MTIALAIIIAGALLIAFGLTARHYAHMVIDEILAAEQRQIERDRVRGLDAGFSSGWHGGGRR